MASRVPVLLLMLLASSCAGQGGNQSELCPESCDYEYWSHQLVCVDIGCTGIPLDAVDNPDQITRIDMHNNQITELPVLKYTSLVYLDLSWNQIQNIAPNALGDCKELQILNLTHNLIVQIDPGLFKFMSKLQEVLLGNNSLSVIESNTFFFTSGLEVLDLQSNKLTSASGLDGMSKLKVLFLNDNQIGNITDMDFSGLTSLEHMCLQNNRILNIDSDAFFTSKALTSINLSHNQLNHIPDGLFFGHDKLKSLLLNDNGILTLQRNLLTSLYSLDFISLDRNPLRSISNGVFPHDMTSLSIRECWELTVIRNLTFTGLKYLQNVTITNNPRLYRIDAGAFDHERSAVRNLNLSGNALRSVDERLVNWNSLATVDLGGNQWDCDCTLVWMIGTNLTTTSEDQKARCYYPRRFRGLPVVQLDRSEFSCSYYSRYQYALALALVSLVTVLFVVITAGLIYRFRTRVLPCWFQDGGRYRALYSKEEIDPESLYVRPDLDKVVDEKTALKSDIAPTPV